MGTIEITSADGSMHPRMAMLVGISLNRIMRSSSTTTMLIIESVVARFSRMTVNRLPHRIGSVPCPPCRYLRAAGDTTTATSLMIRGIRRILLKHRGIRNSLRSEWAVLHPMATVAIPLIHKAILVMNPAVVVRQQRRRGAHLLPLDVPWSCNPITNCIITSRK
jgi:hypothetical protein